MPTAFLIWLARRMISAACGEIAARSKSARQFVSSSRRSQSRTRIVRTPALRPHSTSIALSPMKNERREIEPMFALRFEDHLRAQACGASIRSSG